MDLSGVCVPEFTGVRMCKILGQGGSSLAGLMRLCFQQNASTSVGVNLLVKLRWDVLRGSGPFLEIPCLMLQLLHSLFKGTYQMFRTLNLSYGMLDAGAIDYLVRGAWPHLAHLYLHDKCLEGFLTIPAISFLLLGSWPLL
ncbi:TPA: hypothetical protein ACH3X1_013491 [Trebouxia sp. C0004]